MKPPIDPDVVPLVAAMRASGRPAVHEMSVAEARAMADAIYDPWTPAIDVARSEILHAGALRFNVHWPCEAMDGTCLPVALCFHGGGWALGNVDNHALLAREYAARGGVILIDVDYRLAPEHKFPAAIEDGLAAMRWAQSHVSELGGDPARIGFIGESAGANIAFGTAIAAREAGVAQACAIVAIVPCTTLAADVSFASRSMFDGRDYLLTRRHMQWFTALYLARPEDADDPRASPLLASDLAGFPPTTIITAECDLLRDEGAAFAARLNAAGVSVDYRCVAGGVHGSIGLGPDVRSGRESLELTGQALRRF